MAATKENHILKNFKRPEGAVGNIIAQHMDEEYAELNKWAAAIMNVQKGENILEVGFGTGIAIEEMSALAAGGLVAGIDYSELMLMKAQHRNAAAINQGHVDLRHADILNLPDFGIKFDKILAVNNMMYWENPDLALQNLKNVLKPNGYLNIFWQRRPDYITSQEGQEEFKWYNNALNYAGFNTEQELRSVA